MLRCLRRYRVYLGGRGLQPPLLVGVVGRYPRPLIDRALAVLPVVVQELEEPGVVVLIALAVRSNVDVEIIERLRVLELVAGHIGRVGIRFVVVEGLVDIIAVPEDDARLHLGQGVDEVQTTLLDHTAQSWFILLLLPASKADHGRVGDVHIPLLVVPRPVGRLGRHCHWRHTRYWTLSRLKRRLVR